MLMFVPHYVNAQFLEIRQRMHWIEVVETAKFTVLETAGLLGEGASTIY